MIIAAWFKASPRRSTPDAGRLGRTDSRHRVHVDATKHRPRRDGAHPRAFPEQDEIWTAAVAAIAIASLAIGNSPRWFNTT